MMEFIFENKEPCRRGKKLLLEVVIFGQSSSPHNSHFEYSISQYPFFQVVLKARILNNSGPLIMNTESKM